MGLKSVSRIGVVAALLFTAASAVPALDTDARVDRPLHPHGTHVRGVAPAGKWKNFSTQDDAVTVVSSYEFQPLNNSEGFSSASGVRGATGPGFQLVAPFGGLPHGVLLESFTVYYFDADAAENLRFRACRRSRDAATGFLGAQECFIEYFSAGQDLDGSVAVLPVPEEFQNYLLVADTDGDLDDDAVEYFMVVDTPGGLGTAIGPVHIRWRRQVSPRPLTATFNDVPTTDPAYQFVEALAASGITAGCGGGAYCPDSPLTRRQMAVFLAKALGLHWAP